ncbi:XAC2610-related protein [Hymenobacter coalescens]
MLVSFTAQAQREYLIDDFSPQYYARIRIEQPTEVSNPGSIAVYDKATGRQLLKVDADPLYFGPDDRVPASPRQRVACREQSLIIHEDFNFDGRKDLALEDGRNGCHGNTTYQVYLATPTGFAHSEPFTQLAECELFQVDAKRQRLSTQRSGAWGYTLEEYAVRGNVPFLVSRFKQDHEHWPFLTETQQTWNGRRLMASVQQLVLLGEEEIICAFALAESKRRVVVFALDSTTLHYALLRPDNSLEFTYPAPGAENARPFTLHQSATGLSLRFQNGSAQYEICETPTGRLTVTARSGAKTRSLTGVAAGRTGSLQPLRTARFENLQAQP